MKKILYSIYIFLLLLSGDYSVQAQTLMTAPNQDLIIPQTSPPEPAPEPVNAFSFIGAPSVTIRADGLNVHWVTTEDSTGIIECGVHPGQYDLSRANGSSPGIKFHGATVPLPTADTAMYCRITAHDMSGELTALALLEINAKQIAAVRSPATQTPTAPPAPSSKQPEVQKPAVIPPPPNKHFSVSISINGGTEVLTSRAVSVELDVIMNPVAAAITSPPQFNYQLSESPTFAGADWQPLTGPVTWMFEGNNTTRTLYAKVKNGSEESAVVSKTFYIAEAEVANAKRLGAIAGASALAFFAVFNWASFLSIVNDLRQVKNEAKTVAKT